MATQLLGKSVKVWLENGESFHLKVTGYEENENGVHLVGYDHEGMNRVIDFDTLRVLGTHLEKEEVT
jgi:hypothetical protein